MNGPSIDNGHVKEVEDLPVPDLGMVSHLIVACHLITKLNTFNPLPLMAYPHPLKRYGLLTAWWQYHSPSTARPATPYCCTYPHHPFSSHWGPWAWTSYSAGLSLTHLYFSSRKPPVSIKWSTAFVDEGMSPRSCSMYTLKQEVYPAGPVVAQTL